MPLVITAHTMPEVDVLLISGSVQSDEDLYNLRKSVRKAKEIVAVGICAISGGVAHLGDRDDIRSLFLEQHQRRHVPRMLPKSHPVDALVKVDRYLPGCPPTPELFMALLGENDELKPASSVCVECGRFKDKNIRPAHLTGFQSGEVDPDAVPGQPGLPVHRRLDPRRLPRPVHPPRPPVRGLPRPVQRLYRKRIQRLAEQHHAGLHHHDRHPARRGAAGAALASVRHVPLPVQRLRRVRSHAAPERNGAVMTTLIFPLSRIEGHAQVAIEEINGQVLSAHFQATELRGFDQFVQGIPASRCR